MVSILYGYFLVQSIFDQVSRPRPNYKVPTVCHFHDLNTIPTASWLGQVMVHAHAGNHKEQLVSRRDCNAICGLLNVWARIWGAVVMSAVRWGVPSEG
jgi:hypothetical protein